jgi:hypothetical protein
MRTPNGPETAGKRRLWSLEALGGEVVAVGRDPKGELKTMELELEGLCDEINKSRLEPA